MNGEETTDPPREYNSQPTAYHLKFRGPSTKTSTVVSDIMERLNNHTIDNGDVEVHSSEFPVEFNLESVTDKDPTLIESINDDEMDHLLEFINSENDDILDVDLQILQS